MWVRALLCRFDVYDFHEARFVYFRDKLQAQLHEAENSPQATPAVLVYLALSRLAAVASIDADDQVPAAQVVSSLRKYLSGVTAEFSQDAEVSNSSWYGAHGGFFSACQALGQQPLLCRHRWVCRASARHRSASPPPPPPPHPSIASAHGAHAAVL